MKDSKKYKVIALNVGGLGNKIHYLNEIVSEENFIPGRAEELVRQGFLSPEEDDEPSKEKPLNKMNVEELIQKALEKGMNEEDLKGLTKKELIELLA